MTCSTLPGDSSPGLLVRRKATGLAFLEAGDGPPVVLLHGIPGSALSWSAVGERLSAAHRVVIPDLLGFGQSDPPTGDAYLETHAERVQRLLQHLGILEFVLGGHDFGGPVALTLRRRHPEFRVRALLLSATNLFTDTFVPAPLRLARIRWLATPTFRLLAGNRIGLRLMHAVATVQKATIPWRQFRRHLTASAIDQTRRIFQRSLADLPANYRAIEQQLPHLAIATLVLWGDRDPFFALPVAERSQRAIPGAILRVLPATGHFVPEEQPTRVADEIRAFLGTR